MLRSLNRIHSRDSSERTKEEHLISKASMASSNIIGQLIVIDEAKFLGFCYHKQPR